MNPGADSTDHFTLDCHLSWCWLRFVRFIQGKMRGWIFGGPTVVLLMLHLCIETCVLNELMQQDANEMHFFSFFSVPSTLLSAFCTFSALQVKAEQYHGLSSHSAMKRKGPLSWSLKGRPSSPLLNAVSLSGLSLRAWNHCAKGKVMDFTFSLLRLPYSTTHS